MLVGQGQLKELVKALHPGKLSAVDAEAIVELTQLALDADGREDSDEIKTFFALGKAVFGLAGMGDAELPTFVGGDDDGERMKELASSISATPAKELAFACAHVLSISDVDIAPEESDFLAALLDTLGISDERSEALVEQVNELITPPE
ncbi:MAG TPA: hypothetical protein VGM39_21020 [Kofleriaceae bacterium]|jgi:hypothetical protein